MPIGLQELGIIALVVAVLFGPRQLPKLGRAVGETIKEFRDVRKTLEGEVADVGTEARAATRSIRRAVNE